MHNKTFLFEILSLTLSHYTSYYPHSTFDVCQKRLMVKIIMTFEIRAFKDARLDYNCSYVCSEIYSIYIHNSAIFMSRYDYYKKIN